MKVSITITTPDRTIKFDGDNVSTNFTIMVLRELLSPGAGVSLQDLQDISKDAAGDAARVTNISNQLNELAKPTA